MKYLLSIILTLFIAPFVFANDYVPDENHSPPNVIEEQEERKDLERQEADPEEEGKHMDVRNPSTDPRFEEFKDKMPGDREYEYVP